MAKNHHFGVNNLETIFLFLKIGFCHFLRFRPTKCWLDKIVDADSLYGGEENCKLGIFVKQRGGSKVETLSEM